MKVTRWLGAAILGWAAAVATGRGAEVPAGLAWTSERMEYSARAGQDSIVARFHFKNGSAGDATISDVTTSCGCTVAVIPKKPWVLHQGEEGDITATVDVRGKAGQVIKAVYVKMPGLTKTLSIVVNLPPPKGDAPTPSAAAAALAVRQAVFKGKCATCHADPLWQKTGAELFVTGCAICHEGDRRSSAVPRLDSAEVARQARGSPQFWRDWITAGKDGTLMPAFGSIHGGPLTSAQIDSLVQYLSARVTGGGYR